MDAIFGKDANCPICEDDLKDNATGQTEKTPEQIEKEHLKEIKHKIISYYENRNNGKVVKRKILRKKNNMLAFDYLKRTNSYNHYLNYTMIDIVGKLREYNILDAYEEMLEIICNNIRDNIDIEGYMDFIPYYSITVDMGYTKQLQDLAIDTWKIINTKSSAVSIGQLKKSRRIRNKDKLDVIEKLSIKLHEEYEASEVRVVTEVYNLYKIFELDIPDDILTQFVDCIIKLIELDNIKYEIAYDRYKRMTEIGAVPKFEFDENIGELTKKELKLLKHPDGIHNYRDDSLEVEELIYSDKEIPQELADRFIYYREIQYEICL